MLLLVDVRTVEPTTMSCAVKVAPSVTVNSGGRRIVIVSPIGTSPLPPRRGNRS
jgi:hypothetical protein